MLNQHEGGEIPLKKRKNEIVLQHTSSIIADSTEETVITTIPEAVAVINVPLPVKKEEGTILEREKRIRTILEDQVRTLETQFPDNAHDLSQHVTLHYTTESSVKTEIEAPKPPEAPLLEAAIKAEPRVEVEVLGESTPESRLYLASTSRQNLETIVEAIRHLEGDHLFGEAPPDAPLALTKKPEPSPRPGVIVVKHS